MPGSTLTRESVDVTLGAIDHALTLEFTGPLTVCGTGTGKTSGAQLALAATLAELAKTRTRYEQLSGRFGALLTAAQAAVIEARASRRDPLTPITEALRALGELPEPGVRLSEVVAESAAAWPRGVLG